MRKNYIKINLYRLLAGPSQTGLSTIVHCQLRTQSSDSISNEAHTTGPHTVSITVLLPLLRLSGIKGLFHSAASVARLILL